MTLIKSISGIRGTIGGDPGSGLSPVDVVKFASAYGQWIRECNNTTKLTVITGRDARVSGELIINLINSTLSAMGIDVITLGLASTPTVEIAVVAEKANGGIIVTASHNPANWNAMKLLDSRGEFLDSDQGARILALAEKGKFSYSDYTELGVVRSITDYDDRHIDMVLELELVDVEAIRKAEFKVAIDTVNSVGGLILPKLLNRLGVKEITGINLIPDGIFNHNPEPIPENLQDISRLVADSGSDLGFVVDPDVDRLAIISEDGTFFNEEYTLVACADYVLSINPGNSVSNMSSSRALRDVTEKYGGKWSYSAVGEVNVVSKMKDTGAVIGGEGNGGIIYPDSHYGRDALVGIALFLSALAKRQIKCSVLKESLPQYVISKNRVEIDDNVDVDKLFEQIEKEYNSDIVDRGDGILIENKEGWVQIRRSNTEPILRIYSEGRTLDIANSLAAEIIKIVKRRTIGNQ